MPRMRARGGEAATDRHVTIDGDAGRILDELVAETGRPAPEVVAGALRLLGITRAVHGLHGVVDPVPDPRDG